MNNLKTVDYELVTWQLREREYFPREGDDDWSSWGDLRGCPLEFWEERIKLYPDNYELRPLFTEIPKKVVQTELLVLERDTIAVNFMRLAGLDKHKARECADIVHKIYSMKNQNAPAGEQSDQVHPIKKSKCPPCMNIYGNIGRFVVYTGKNGYDSTHTLAASKGLVVGESYQVSDCIINQSSTDVYLYGIDGCWNSVIFADLKDWIDWNN